MDLFDFDKRFRLSILQLVKRSLPAHRLHPDSFDIAPGALPQRRRVWSAETKGNPET